MLDGSVVVPGWVLLASTALVLIGFGYCLGRRGRRRAGREEEALPAAQLRLPTPRSAGGVSGPPAEGVKTTAYPRLAEFAAHEGVKTSLHNLRDLFTAQGSAESKGRQR